jgi:glycerol uptake facilitator-like aquaporin
MLEYVPGIGGWMQGLIRGGRDIGPATLSIFFAIHTAIIPAFLLVLMPWHFWRVRRAGGLAVPRRADETEASRDDNVPTIPNLILKEIVVALVLIAVIMAISVIFNAPLEAKANPGLSPNQGALVLCRHSGTAPALSPAVCVGHYTCFYVGFPNQHSLHQLPDRHKRDMVRFTQGPAYGSRGRLNCCYHYARWHHCRRVCH